MTKTLSSNNKIGQDNFLEYEDIILGAIMLNNHWYKFYNDIHSQMFVYTPNQMIWKSIEKLKATKTPIDIISVDLEIRKKYKQTDFPSNNSSLYVARCTNRVSSTSQATMERYVLHLMKEYIQRQSIRILQSSIKKIVEQDDVPSRVVKISLDYIKKIESNSFESFNDSDIDIEFHVKKTLENFKENKQGISTHYLQLDRVINGLNPSDVLVIAARPGMGKTALALSIINNTASSGIPIGMISLEMSAVQLINRLIAMRSSLNTQITKKPDLMTEQQKIKYYEEAAIIGQLPIYINDKARLNVEQICTIARTMKDKHDIQVLVIDYLQLISNSLEKGEIREQQVSHNSRELKLLAKELDICIIELSQLSREVEKRSDKKPILSDLRESGAIEQDADIVAFLFRPAYYNILQNAKGEDLKHVLQVIIAKNRHGNTESVYLYFDKITTKVVDSKLKIVNYEESSF